MKKFTIQTIFLAFTVFFTILTIYTIITPDNTTDLLTNQEIRKSAEYDWVSKWNSSGISGDTFVDVEIDSAGNLAPAGSIWNPSTDITLVKYDSAGIQLWNYTKDWGSWDDTNAVAVNGTDIYISVDAIISGKKRCYLAKFNSSGDLIWNKTWVKQGVSGAYSADMVMSPAVDFYISGEMAYTPNVDYQYFLVKLNSTGDEVWNTTFGEHSSARRPIFGSTFNNDIVYVAGQIRNQSASKYYPLLVKLNATTGEQLWNISWVTGNSGSIQDVITDSSGSIYVTGYVEYPNTLFLRKYHANGTLVWEKSDLNEEARGYGLTIKDDTILYIAGEIGREGSIKIALLMKYGTNGTLLGYGTWDNDDSTYSSAKAVALDSNSSTYLVGSTSGGSKNVAFILKNLETSTLPNNGGGIPSFPLIGVLCLIYAILLIRILISKQTRRLW